MPVPLPHNSSLSSLISVAVAPVVLISAVAILLSGYTTKYGNIADRMRNLAAEFRRSDSSPDRCESIRRQMVLFRRRIQAMWAASALLSLALLSFVCTVLSVIFAQRVTTLTLVGAVCLVIGLLLAGCAITLDLYEIYLGRLTMAGEIGDLFAHVSTTAQDG